MIMPAKQTPDTRKDGARVNDDQVLECLDWMEKLQEKGFTKGELSFLVGYTTEAGLPQCARRMSFTTRVHGELRRLYAAVTEDPSALASLKRSASKDVKAKRRGGAKNSRADQPVNRLGADRPLPRLPLDGIVGEATPSAVRHDTSAPRPATASPTPRRSDSIWGLFEIARTGVGSVHRTIREAKERFGTALTSPGLDLFMKRLDDLDRDLEEVLAACR